MGELSARKKHVKRTVDIGNVASQAEAWVADLDTRIEAIQLLIPLALQAVTDELQQAVGELGRSAISAQRDGSAVATHGTATRRTFPC